MRAEEDGDGLDMLRAVAVAGQFRRPPCNAANDQPVARLVLVLFWWLYCVNYRAKLAGSGAVSCKIDGRAVAWLIPLYPAWLHVFPVSALIPALCQNDHLPTDS